MKHFITGLLLLSSLSTIAAPFHVEPTDSIRLIPEGSYIEFTKDFNVKPVLDAHLLGNSKRIRCWMVTNVSSKDRVIKAGTKIEIRFLDMYYPRFSTPKDEKIKNIYCSNPVTEDRELLVGEFEDAIKSVAKLVMSEPVEF